MQLTSPVPCSYWIWRALMRNYRVSSANCIERERRVSYNAVERRVNADSHLLMMFVSNQYYGHTFEEEKRREVKRE